MSRTSVHRNDPCPCGSGRKYKNCHGRGASAMGRPVAVPLWAMILGVLVVGGAAATGAVLATRPRNPVTERVMPAPAGAILPSPGMASVAGPDPSPWTYDPRTNKHWEPNHKHWHNGPAPVGAARDSVAPPLTFSVGDPVQPNRVTTSSAPAVAAPGSTPEPSPWTYDPVNKQYWDPRHRHWHAGPAPSVEARRAMTAPATAPAKPPATATAPASPAPAPAAPATAPPATGGTASDSTRR